MLFNLYRKSIIFYVVVAVEASGIGSGGNSSFGVRDIEVVVTMMVVVVIVAQKKMVGVRAK